MTQNVGEQLKTITTAAIEHNARLAEEAAAADLYTETGLDPEQEEAIVSTFVERNLAPAVGRAIEEAKLQAEQGQWSSRTTWGFNGESDDPELPMNLLRYRGLRGRVIEQLTGLGIAASEVDTRSGYFWRPDPAVESGLVWRQSPHRVIGVELSWEEPIPIDEASRQTDPATASRIREHLDADAWLRQGQASPL